MEIVKKPEKRVQVIYNLLDWPDLPPFGTGADDDEKIKNLEEDFVEKLEKKDSPWVSFRNGKFWLTPPPTSETWKAVKFNTADLVIHNRQNTNVYCDFNAKSSIMNYGGNNIVCQITTQGSYDRNRDSYGITVSLGEDWKSRPIDIELDYGELKTSYRNEPALYEIVAPYIYKSKTLASLLMIGTVRLNGRITVTYRAADGKYYPDGLEGGFQTKIADILMNVTWIG